MEYDNSTDSKELTAPLAAILQADNIATLFTEEQLTKIGSQVVDWYTEDKESRSDWEKKNADALKLSMQVVETKSYPWPNASNVKFPLLTIASLQFSARIYPALIKAPDLVKYRVMGKDPQGQKAARATRVQKYMSYQLLEEDEHWEESQDKLFIALPILGCVFKKTYFDPMVEKIRSRVVFPDNLILHYYAQDLERSRATERFNLFPREIKERQLRGLYVDSDVLKLLEPGSVEISKDTAGVDKRQGIKPPPSDDETPRQYLESHCFWDFDGDGLDEPYVVTVDFETKFATRIVKRYESIVSEQSLKADQLAKDNFTLWNSLPPPELVAQGAQDGSISPEQQQQIAARMKQIEFILERNNEAIKALFAEIPKVIRIEPKVHYTKYSFIPAPDGGFYDLGFGQLLGPINASVDTLINQLIDSGSLQNGSQGFIGKGARIQGGKIRFEPYEWKRVAVAGATLRDSLVPLPVNQPSAVLFQLLGLLIQYAERIGSVTDVMSGENPGQNTPAYNMSAMLEQGLQVFNGVFKRIYRSFRQELRKIYKLNGQYLNPATYVESLEEAYNILQADFTGDPKDLIPAADPNAFSNMESMMKAQFLAQRAMQVPGYNPIAVERRLLESMDIPDLNEVFPINPDGSYGIPPQPNPEFEVELADMQRRTLEGKIRGETDAARAQAEISLNEAKTIEIISNIKDAQAKERAQLALESMKGFNENTKGRIEVLLKQMDLVKADKEMQVMDKKIELASKQAAKASASASSKK